MAEKSGNVVVNVGGDHSIGSATICASLAKNPNTRVVWVDAHADFANHELNSSRNYHGAPLGHICGATKIPGFLWMKDKLPFRNVVLIGIRDIDSE